jgi:hypothetical protein
LAKLTSAIRTSALLAMLATTGEAWAAMAPATLPELGREATIVALGRVEGREGRWSEDRSAIRTDVTAVVLRAVKGDARPGGRLSFRVAGGEVGDVGLAVSGEARPRVGEEAVLLLAPAPDGRDLALVGGEEGYYPVHAGKVVTVDGRELGLDRFLAELQRSGR